MSEVLTEKMRRFLSEVRFGVLATLNRDGSPQLTVMWYELRDGEIVFNTRRGRIKDRNLRRDPRAAFIVEDGYRYFRTEGRTIRDADPEKGQEDIRRLAIRYHGQETGERMSRETFRQQERVTYRLPVGNVYAGGFS